MILNIDIDKEGGLTSLTVKWPVLVGYTKANDNKASLLLASGATSFT